MRARTSLSPSMQGCLVILLRNNSKYGIVSPTIKVDMRKQTLSERNALHLLPNGMSLLTLSSTRVSILPLSCCGTPACPAALLTSAPQVSYSSCKMQCMSPAHSPRFKKCLPLFAKSSAFASTWFPGCASLFALLSKAFFALSIRPDIVTVKSNSMELVEL